MSIHRTEWGHCRAVRSLGFCLLVVSMCGCVDHDLSADPHIAGDFAHHKFVTRQEAILYSKDCSRAWTYCDFVMPIAPHDMPTDSGTGLPLPRSFPPTLAAFEQDKTTWIARIRAWALAGQPWLQPDHTQVYGGLPIGTIIEIEQVMSISDGENGRYWRVFGVIQSGEFAQRRVILPQGGGIPPAMIDWDFLERASPSNRSGLNFNGTSHSLLPDG
jgi:hypothetical protein